MLDSISFNELLQWGEYQAVEPFGEWRADVRSAHIVSMIANVNRDPKKKPDPYTVSDFMLKFEKRERVVEPEAEKGAVVSPGVIAWLFSQGSKRDH